MKRVPRASHDGFDFIERAYGVRFARGMKVIALGKPGTVTNADNHIYVRLDGMKFANPYHPTDVKPVEPTP